MAPAGLRAAVPRRSPATPSTTIEVAVLSEFEVRLNPVGAMVPAPIF